MAGMNAHAGVIRALLLVHFLAIWGVALYQWRHPLANWDIVPYAALVRAEVGQSPQELSRLAYDDVRRYVGEDYYWHMIGGNGPDRAYRVAVHEDPAALLDNLKLYSVKPLYIMLSRMALPLTGNAASAAALISAAALAMLLSVLPLFLRPLLGIVAVWALLFLGQPEVMLVARCATPDSLSMLLVGACALAALNRRHWAAVGALALLAVLARPDAAILVVPWLAGMGWLQRHERSVVPLLCCALLCFGVFVLLGKLALPWSTLFWHTFVAREPFPSAIHFAVTPADYLAVLRRTIHSMLQPRPLLFFLGGIALALGPWLLRRRVGPRQLLAAVAAMGMGMHYLIFPIDEFGRERLFLGSYALLLMAALLAAPRVGDASAHRRQA